MADNTTTTIMSVYATVASRLKDLAINDGNLIFIHDKHRIALDYNGKRTIYNQIEELATEQDRVSILAPVSGTYYFVIETAVLWTYQEEWIQITSLPEQIVFIGTELPELGTSKTLYVDKTARQIAVWDVDTNGYTVVSDYTQEIPIDDINALFA